MRKLTKAVYISDEGLEDLLGLVRGLDGADEVMRKHRADAHSDSSWYLAAMTQFQARAMRLANRRALLSEMAKVLLLQINAAKRKKQYDRCEAVSVLYGRCCRKEGHRGKHTSEDESTHWVELLVRKNK